MFALPRALSGRALRTTSCTVQQYSTHTHSRCGTCNCTCNWTDHTRYCVLLCTLGWCVFQAVRYGTVETRRTGTVLLYVQYSTCPGLGNAHTLFSVRRRDGVDTLILLRRLAAQPPPDLSGLEHVCGGMRDEVIRRQAVLFFVQGLSMKVAWQEWGDRCQPICSIITVNPGTPRILYSSGRTL